MNILGEYRQLMLNYLPRPIQTEAEHRKALKHLEKIMVPNPSKGLAMFIEVLATLVEQYEEKQHPMPEANPAGMLAHCIEAKGITAAQVSRDTGISTTVLSNILAGRRGISSTNAVKLGQYFNRPAGEFLEHLSELAPR